MAPHRQRSVRRLRPAASFLALWPLTAHASPVLDALHAQNWAEATRQAGPGLGAQLVTWQRLQTPGAASPAEIGAFIAAHPAWPELGALRRALAEAVAHEPDDKAALLACHAFHPAGLARLRCALAERAAGDAQKAGAVARTAWVDGITGAAEEQAFLAQFPHAATPEDQWRRFDALDWAGAPAADRQAARLDGGRRALAAARLAFRHGSKTAPDTLRDVPAELLQDPVLVLARARVLRAAGERAAALALWREQGQAAEAAAPPERRPAFWNERDRLARALLQDGDARGAEFLADDLLAGPDQAPDALFLAGWIALRALHDGPLAAAKFRALAAQSPAAITQGRAWYWLALCETGAASQADFSRAAAWPTTYYGQLALGALHRDLAPALAALHDPAPDGAAQRNAAADDRLAAETLLLAWGDAPHAREFLQKTLAGAPPAMLALLARRALRDGMPDVAVAAARLAGRQGAMLPETGWPRPYTPAPDKLADPALVLGLMRQESSFDPAIVSHAGAVGLMQMTPDTAHDQGGSGAELTDPSANMRLGIAYLRGLIGKFDGVIPYALAAYNAGPHRVRAWIGSLGDAAPRGDTAMLDWIEQIPYAETRNYVERVLENRAIYAALPPVR